MFIISIYTPSGWQGSKTNNLEDVYNIVLGITRDKSKAKKAMEAASDMGNGGLYTKCFYKIECVEK